ncbi:MAG: type II secretion system protein [Candidatus Paceibacterota bacterium]
MNYRKNQGFTLIELLVVIAIIGILSSVVLASLNTARGKGADAAVKSNLNSVRASAELRYDMDKGTYDNVCSDATVMKALDTASYAGSGDTDSDACFADSENWATSAPLKVINQVGPSSGVDYWCVDSSGVAKITDTAPTTTVCP